MPPVTARERAFPRSTHALSRWHTYVQTDSLSLSLSPSLFPLIQPHPLFYFLSSLFHNTSLPPQIIHCTTVWAEAPRVWIPLDSHGVRLIGVCCWISWVTSPCWDNSVQNTAIMTQSTEINTIHPEFLKFGPSVAHDTTQEVSKSVATAHRTAQSRCPN